MERAERTTEPEPLDSNDDADGVPGFGVLVALGTGLAIAVRLRRSH